MKKITLSLLGVLLLWSCAKEESTLEESAKPVDFGLAKRECMSAELFKQQMLENPDMAAKQEGLEELTRKFIENNQARLVNGIIEIPVHVNVLYNTAAQNVSNAQIQSQIDVLNEDFSSTNSDYSSIPSVFQGVASGDVTVRFVWDPSTGTTRKSTTKKNWRTNDDMKRSSRGGIDATNCAGKMNIWVCVLANNILGYAQFPGGACATDGVVIHTNAFGRGNYSLFTAFNKGRTATHEVGHWLNLRHIWGDATCGNDFVADTPVHNASNGGCPTFPHYSTCSGTPIEMTMNYMDYTNDACMYMFTAGQKSRMLATFAAGAPRNAFAQP